MRYLPLLILLVIPAFAAEPNPAPRTVKVAAVQCSSDLGDVVGNSRKLSALVKEAAKAGAKIVVLPETVDHRLPVARPEDQLARQGNADREAIRGQGPEGLRGSRAGPRRPSNSAALAKELDIYLTIPLLEVDFSKGKDKPRYFNTVCLANPKGELVAHYRKLTPWPYPEKSWATPGDRGVQTYDTEYGRVGLGICFDIHTILEKYEPHHIWCLLYPIAWVDAEHPAEWMFHRLPQRVKPFKHHLVGANWSVDKKQNWRGYGFSVIISNEGKVVASAKSLYGSEIVYADLPTAK